MCEQYSHLLIPHSVDFVPRPNQIAEFIYALVKLDTAPRAAKYRIAKPSGTFRKGLSPLTGDEILIPRREFSTVESPSELETQLTGLGDYIAFVSGHGPSGVPPFKLYAVTGSQESEFNEVYGYEVRLCLRETAVSTNEMPEFGSPCSTKAQHGIFSHPRTKSRIEVPHAACARFWIEFEFGKWLFPKIDKSLDLIHPSILESAIDIFGAEFAQGCRCV
jgi:hypothetical protein